MFEGLILKVWKWSQPWAVALKISNLNSFKQCSPSQSVKHPLREDRDTPAVSGSNEARWNNMKVLWNGQVPTPYWFPLNDHALASVLFFFHSFHKNFPYQKHQQPADHFNPISTKASKTCFLLTWLISVISSLLCHHSSRFYSIFLLYILLQIYERRVHRMKLILIAQLF